MDMSRFRYTMTAILLAGVTASGVGSVGEACSSLVVGKEASATGHAFFGRSEDCFSWGMAKMEIYP